MTAGRIILDMPNPAVDRNGIPIPGARLYFVQAGTSIVASIYTDENLLTAIPNPLIADGAARFVEVWAASDQAYDVRWTDASDALLYFFPNISPLVSDTVNADGDGVNKVAFRASLGLGTAATADTGTTDHTLPYLDGANTWTGPQNMTGGFTINGFRGGYLGIPMVVQNAPLTFGLGDRGAGYLHTNGSNYNWTIPLHAAVAFDLGDTIYLRNKGTGIITIQRTSGVNLRIAGNSSSANVALASYGQAVLVNDSGDDWVVSGAGIS